MAKLTDELAALEANKTRVDAHYASIGRVADSWSSVELMVDTISWSLAGLGEIHGVCLTSQIGVIQRKLDALISLLKLQGAGPKLLKSVNKFSDKARSLQELRNRIVHDPWLVMDSDKEPRRIEASARRTAVMDEVPMSTSDVLAVDAKIDGLWDDLQEIWAASQPLAHKPSRE